MKFVFVYARLFIACFIAAAAAKDEGKIFILFLSTFGICVLMVLL